MTARHKKLSLRKQSLRRLDDGALAGVAGGTLVVIPLYASTNFNTNWSGLGDTTGR